MHKDNAKDYLPLVQALADGKTIQRTFLGNEEKWQDTDEIIFSIPIFLYRIKPEPKMQLYRVGLFKNLAGYFTPCVFISESAESDFEKSAGFVRWITDRIEYEIPE